MAGAGTRPIPHPLPACERGIKGGQAPQEGTAEISKRPNAETGTQARRHEGTVEVVGSHQANKPVGELSRMSEPAMLQIASVEVPVGELPRISEPARLAEVSQHFRALGYHQVTIDPRGLRSGNLNEAIRVNLRPAR